MSKKPLDYKLIKMRKLAALIYREDDTEETFENYRNVSMLIAILHRAFKSLKVQSEVLKELKEYIPDDLYSQIVLKKLEKKSTSNIDRKKKGRRSETMPEVEYTPYVDKDEKSESRTDYLMVTVEKLQHENKLLNEEVIRLTRLCQSLVQKINACVETLEDVTSKTYIFRRNIEDED